MDIGLTQKQLLGFITFITLIIYFLVSQDYIIVRLGPKLSTTETPSKKPEQSKDNTGALEEGPKTDLTKLDENDKQDLLLTPPDQRPPTQYEAALNEATQPVTVLDFPAPSEAEGISGFQNFSDVLH